MVPRVSHPPTLLIRNISELELELDFELELDCEHECEHEYECE